jgi:GNAT superfamily N-acetyltransferase
MDRVLRNGRDLAREYPLVFEGRFPGRIVAFEEAGDVRSACAFLVRNLVLPGARIRAGLIGSVATDPDWRRQGFASRVLDEAEQCLAREGCMLAVLWADDAEFYLARGWQPFGCELDFVLDAGSLASLPQRGGIRRVAPDDFAAVHRLYESHPERFERSAEETAALMCCPEMETLIRAEDRDVCAYACLGRGADFAHTLHVWAGAPEDVLALTREHMLREGRRGAPGDIALITPPSADHLHARLRESGARESRGILGLAKLLDPEPAAELIDRYGGSALRVSVESNPGQATRVTLWGPRGGRTLSPAEILQLLFPPRGERALIEACQAELGVELAGLPLRPFAWGLDSI